ncbi:MAG: hypothetical protein ACREEM_14305 [Blastocatellia bacterium]
MTRHSANQSSLREPHRRPPSFDGADEPVRVLLVAIHSGAQPAAFPGPRPLQRLQVMLAAPDEQIEFDPLGAMAQAIASAPPQVIPRMPAVNGDARLRPRPVHGEILSDENGRLYEKIGRHIRPLQRLFSGPRGEVLELPAEAQAEQRRPPSPPSLQAGAAEASNPETQAKARTDSRADASPEQRQPQRQPPRCFPQHPGPGAGSGARYARQTQAPFPRPQPQRDEATDRQQAQAPAPAADHRPTVRQHDGPRQAEASAGSTTTGAAPNGPKTAIPERWINPWEFQISREEALYDLQLAPSFRGSLATFIRGLIGWFGQRRAWRKWQTLLAGRSLDEQLWSAPPPRGSLAHPAAIGQFNVQRDRAKLAFLLSLAREMQTTGVDANRAHDAFAAWQAMETRAAQQSEALRQLLALFKERVEQFKSRSSGETLAALRRIIERLKAERDKPGADANAINKRIEKLQAEAEAPYALPPAPPREPKDPGNPPQRSSKGKDKPRPGSEK